MLILILSLILKFIIGCDGGRGYLFFYIICNCLHVTSVAAPRLVFLLRAVHYLSLCCYGASKYLCVRDLIMSYVTLCAICNAPNIYTAFINTVVRDRFQFGQDSFCNWWVCNNFCVWIDDSYYQLINSRLEYFILIILQCVYVANMDLYVTLTLIFNYSYVICYCVFRSERYFLNLVMFQLLSVSVNIEKYIHICVVELCIIIVSLVNCYICYSVCGKRTVGKICFFTVRVFYQCLSYFALFTLLLIAKCCAHNCYTTKLSQCI